MDSFRVRIAPFHVLLDSAYDHLLISYIVYLFT